MTLRFDEKFNFFFIPLCFGKLPELAILLMIIMLYVFSTNITTREAPILYEIKYQLRILPPMALTEAQLVTFFLDSIYNLVQILKYCSTILEELSLLVNTDRPDSQPLRL